MLGAANIAKFAVLHSASKTKNVTVYAVASRDQAKAQVYAKRNSIPVMHENYDALLADR